MSKMLGSARGYSLVAACLCLIAVQAGAQSEEGTRTPAKSVALETSAIQRVQPAYPPLAKAAKVEGGVVVEITVNEEGNVIAARAVSRHPLLKDAALVAARQWKFTPSNVKITGTLTFTFGSGKTKDIELLNQTIAKDPNSAELRYQLGLLYLEKAEPEKAIGPFKDAISLDPKFAKAHVGLGDAYARSGRTKLAIDAYKKGAQTCPEDADAPFYLGMLYWRQDRYLEAIDAFNEAIKRDSQRYMAYVGIGRSYAGLRRYPEAVGPLNEAVKIKPDSLDAHLELGETYLKLGDKAAAMNEYRMLKGISAFMAEQFLQKIKMLD
jgi:TonB family protein